MLHGVPVRVLPPSPVPPRVLRSLRAGAPVVSPHHALRTSILSDIGLRSEERQFVRSLIQCLLLILTLSTFQLAVRLVYLVRGNTPI